MPHLQYLEKTARHKISQDIEHLNNLINQCDLIDVYRNTTPEEKKMHSFQEHMEHFLENSMLGLKIGLHQY